MANEDLGKEAEEQEAENPAETDKGEEGRDGGAESEEVTDKHGQPGINKERHDKEVAALNQQIEELKAEVAKAAETKEGREKLEKQIEELKADMADKDTSHKLEMAGCKNVKAAKALLGDYDGDVAKLKDECPYLFEEKPKQSGTTGKPPAGASKALDEKLDKIFGV